MTVLMFLLKFFGMDFSLTKILPTEVLPVVITGVVFTGLLVVFLISRDRRRSKPKPVLGEVYDFLGAVKPVHATPRSRMVTRDILISGKTKNGKVREFWQRVAFSKESIRRAGGVLNYLKGYDLLFTEFKGKPNVSGIKRVASAKTPASP